MFSNTYTQQIIICIKYMWNCIKSLFCLYNTEESTENTLCEHYTMIRDIDNYNIELYNDTCISSTNTFDKLNEYMLLLSNTENIDVYSTNDIYLSRNIINNIKIHGTNISKHSKTQIYLYNNKVYKMYTINNIDNYIKIINLIKQHKLKNILIPHNIYYCHNENMYIEIYSYYPFGDLFNFITNNHITYKQIHELYKKIVNIIKKLHKYNITHRDIKLENFLIDYSKKTFNILLIDLDFAALSDENVNFRGGTEGYVPPEIFRINPITDFKGVDIWACGVLLYIFIFNLIPWKSCDITDQDNIEYIEFINTDPNIYWDLHLNKSNIPKKYHNIFKTIFLYTFNLEHTKRLDINNIDIL